MQEKKLSICIPTYNGANHIGSTIDNVLTWIPNECRGFVEILISDNNSNDATAMVVQGYTKEHPELIRYVRNECNLLFNGNIQRCIDEATGEYIHFLGDDDFYNPEGLARILSFCDLDYNLMLVSNNWVWPDGNITVRSESEGSFPDGMELNSRQMFFKYGMVRAWALSCIVVRRSMLKPYQMTRVPDWAHLDLALYAMSRDGAVCFITPEKEPCVSIRVGRNAWLYSELSTQIYVNNFKTVLGSSRFAYSAKELKIAIARFAEMFPFIIESVGSGYRHRINVAICYMKAGGVKAFPVVRKCLALKKPATLRQMREPITGEDIEFFILTYNRADMLKQQLQSLVDQTVPVGRITVVDNGSTDDTEAVVKRFCSSCPTVRYHRIAAHNADNVNSFRLTQDLAKCKYVGVFHDDDITHPQFTEYVIRSLNIKEDIVAVSGGMEYVYNAMPGNMNMLPFRALLWSSKDAVFNECIYSRLNFPLCVYRTAEYKKVKYDSGIYGKMFDNPFLFEISSLGSVVFLIGNFLRYRIHPLSDSNNDKNKITTENVENVVAKLKSLLPRGAVGAFLRSYLLMQYSYMLLRWGGIRCEDSRVALKFLYKRGLINKFEFVIMRLELVRFLCAKCVSAYSHKIKHSRITDRAK